MKYTRIIVWLFSAALASCAWAQFELPVPDLQPKRQTMFAAVDPATPALWVVFGLEKDRFVVLHQDSDSPASVLHPGLESRGEPMTVAAGDGKLFVVYKDLSVQSVGVERDARTGAVSYRVNQLPPLPSGVELLDLAAGANGPLALTTPPPQPPEVTDEDAVGSEDEATQEKSNDTQTEVEPAGPFRLYAIAAGRWKAMPLPEELRTGDGVQVLVVGEQTVIVVNYRDGLVAYRLTGESWRSENYAQVTLPRSAQLVAVMGRIAIVGPRPGESGMLVGQLLHEGKALAAGMLLLPQQSRDDKIGWHAVGIGSRLSVVTASASRQWLVQRDLSEAPDVEADIVELMIAARPAPPLNQELMTLGLIAIVVLFVMATWRSKRLGVDAIVDLPAGMEPAELPRRIVAALIDLVPGVALAMILFDISNPVELVTNWPGLTDNLTQLEPAAVIIGVLVLHSLLSELFTATTIGKRLAGLRVVSVKGKPPNVWQVLTRNVIKAVELMLPLLLLMMLLSPARQRMGDLAGRTVVVKKIENSTTSDSGKKGE